MTINVFGGGNSSAPVFPVQRSVRLRSSASAYFNRTPASAPTLGTKFTYSAWVKLGANTITAANGGALFEAGTTGDLFSTICFLSGSIQFIFRYQNPGVNPAYYVTTSQVFRDPSSWYHILCVADTTQATASNRLLMYVNGVQVTAFASTNYPAQNAVTYFGTQSTPSYIGAGTQSGRGYFDGYMTEVNFIDGQALTPTSFGSINSSTGVWQPIKYSGTYGTNGFYLNFQDNSGATATTIGKDSSGNGNNWTPNNISVTAGVTYDSMLDVPTLTSSTNANFAVINPLKKYTSNLSLTNGNLTASDSNAVVTSAISTMSFGTSGKYYFECTMVAVATANSNYVGVIDATNGFGTAPFQNKGEYRSTGDIYNIAGTAQTAGASYTTNDIIGVAVDVTNGTVQFYKNNVAQGATPSFTFTAGTELWAAISTDNQVGTKTYALNFGQRPFSYTPPTGYVALNTYNLPDSTIPNGATQFAATTYTGNGTSLAVTNTVNGKSFQPDFIWIKDRSNARSNVLQNSVTGAAQYLISDSTGAEATASSGVTSINSNGFTVGTQLTWNGSAETYVGWQWKAGGTAVTNTAGSITSSVSANPSAGFSIVSFAFTASGPQTVGHGLGIAPKLIIVKSRSVVGDWPVYHASIGNTSYVLLDTTGAATASSTAWNNTTPTSSVFTLGTGFVTANYGTNGIAYCFSEIAGFSKFGSYTGNGSTDGAFVYTGFRPRYVCVKASSAVEGWVIWDSARDTYNAMPDVLYPNLSNAEGGSTQIDFLSNGFKLRNTATNGNITGVTYIYMAFAENPFKNALAR